MHFNLTLAKEEGEEEEDDDDVDVDEEEESQESIFKWWEIIAMVWQVHWSTFGRK